MKRFILNKMTLPLFFGTFIILGLLISQDAKAQYCTPYYYYSGYYMGITKVEFGDMTNSSGWASSPGYTDYSSSKSITFKPGDEVEFTVTFGNTYPMELSIWIDYNGDGMFDATGELVYASGYQFSTTGYTNKFTVPANADIGITRMRIMCEYSYMYGGNPPYPCGTNYYYGEAEDYAVDIVSPVYEIFPVCQNKTIYLDEYGTATISAEDIDDGSSSEAGTVTLDIDKSSFDCDDIGENTITLTVTDIYDNTATCEATVTVVDNTSPTISVSVSPSVLWPPNNKMEEITATVTVNDNCGDVSYVLTSITSNENINNDVANAGFGTDDLSFDLRRKRNGNGNGRVYTMTYTATDASGNTATGTATVTVPHNNKSVLTDGSEFDGIVNLHSYPNPFVDETTIEFTLAAQSVTSVKVYNLQGNLVNTLHDGMTNAGLQIFKLSTQNYPAGEYTVILTVGSEQFIHKVMKVK